MSFLHTFLIVNEKMEEKEMAEAPLTQLELSSSDDETDEAKDILNFLNNVTELKSQDGTAEARQLLERAMELFDANGVDRVSRVVASSYRKKFGFADDNSNVNDELRLLKDIIGAQYNSSLSASCCNRAQQMFNRKSAATLCNHIAKKFRDGLLVEEK